MSDKAKDSLSDDELESCSGGIAPTGMDGGLDFTTSVIIPTPMDGGVDLTTTAPMRIILPGNPIK